MTEGRAVRVSPGSIELDHEVASPALKASQALIRVEACGLCGSDSHLLHGMTLPPGASYPVRPGHEVAGVVEQTGAGAEVAVGDSVVLHPLDTCGTCAACLRGDDNLCPEGRMLGIHEAGGLADRLVWPTRRLVKYDGLAPEQAALLPDAVATAYHAWRIAQLPRGGTLAVLGAGGVGTHLLQIAALHDPEARLIAVVRSEATAARLREVDGLKVEVMILDLEGSGRAVARATGGVDVTADFTGASAAPREAVRMTARGGRVVLGSILDSPLDLGVSGAHLVTREIAVIGSYSSTLADLEAVVELAAGGRLDLSRSVSHQFPLSDVTAAYQVLDDRPPGLLRIVLRP